MMIIVIVILAIVASAVWVYVDAGNFDWDGLGYGGPATWALWTLFVWIIFFPLYLYRRNSLVHSPRDRRQPGKHG